MSEIVISGTEYPLVNQTGLADDVARAATSKLEREISRWMDEARGPRRPSIFDRAAYAAPDNPYAQMTTARRAVQNDDILSGVADVTEGLAFQGLKWESANADDADIFNQLSADLNLDNVVRVWHREEYTYSQVIVAIWWGRKTYKVRGYNMIEEPPEKKTDPMTGEPIFSPVIDEATGKPKKPRKVKRKKAYDIAAPTALAFLDPLRVVPLEPDIFGRDRLAWAASAAEYERWDEIEEGTVFDPVMSQFFIGKAGNLSLGEKEDLASLGVDPNKLMLLNPACVFRWTLTKPDYARFPDLRLKSTFPLLDLKQQLMEADRVNLVGAANYILLVRKGTKDDPADQSEIDNLQDNFKVVAKLPVIISDHRLEIDIITPAQDFTLDAGKYDTLDRRIMSRAIGAITVSSSGQRNESTLTVARGIGRLMESRRHMMKRALEQHIARTIVEHPYNEGKFEGEPNLSFIPRNVQLDSDSQVVQAVMALRTQKELSRETILEYIGFDQAVEAQRRENEEESGLDSIFGTSVPFNAPQNNLPGGPQGPNGGPQAPQVSGAQGGRPVGGGKPAQSPQRQAKPRTSTGNTSTKKG